jgi:hypothetical protein
MPTPESLLSQALRATLADLEDGEIPDSEQFREALLGLQYFLPTILGEIHREWRFWGLDGIIPIVARKTGDREVDLFGLCCEVYECWLAPLHVRLQLSTEGDEVGWLECRLGERGQAGILRAPYDCLNKMRKRFQAVSYPIRQVNWEYAVTFGARQP